MDFNNNIVATDSSTSIRLTCLDNYWTISKNSIPTAVSRTTCKRLCPYTCLSGQPTNVAALQQLVFGSPLCDNLAFT